MKNNVRRNSLVTIKWIKIRKNNTQIYRETYKKKWRKIWAKQVRNRNKYLQIIFTRKNMKILVSLIVLIIKNTNSWFELPRVISSIYILLRDAHFWSRKISYLRTMPFNPLITFTLSRNSESHSIGEWNFLCVSRSGKMVSTTNLPSQTVYFIHGYVVT